MLIKTSNAGSLQYITEGVLYHAFEAMLTPDNTHRVIRTLKEQFDINLKGASIHYCAEIKGFMILHMADRPTYLIMRPLQIMINMPEDPMALLDLVEGRYGKQWPFVNRVTAAVMQGGECADYCLEISRLLARISKLQGEAKFLDVGDNMPTPLEVVELWEIRARMGTLHRALQMYRRAIETNPATVGVYQRDDIFKRLQSADLEIRGMHDAILLMKDLYPTQRSERWPTPQ